MIIKKRLVITAVMFVVSAFILQGWMEASETTNGMILGYIFGQDGTTPVPGAVVRVKNTVSGIELQSSVSDQHGIFSISGIENGVYQFAVETLDGEFVASSAFGVKLTESGDVKLALNITPYGRKLEAAIADMPAPKEIEGETFIGRVVNFNPETMLAEIFVMQGRLEWDDSIHALGELTDFYQKVDALEVNESEVRSAVPGQTALLQLQQTAKVGDAVYVAASRVPFAFLAPLAGVATVVAGSSMVAYNIGARHIPDWCEPCSPFKTDEKVKKRKKNR